MRALVLVCLVVFGVQALELERVQSFVVDRENSLMWQDDQKVKMIKLSQAKAREYCDKFSIAGLSDWRLPSVDELKLIVDPKRRDYTNKAFKYKRKFGYWSDDVLWRMLGYYAYYLNFKNGKAMYDNKTYKKYVRCVRDTN